MAVEACCFIVWYIAMYERAHNMLSIYHAIPTGHGCPNRLALFVLQVFLILCQSPSAKGKITITRRGLTIRELHRVSEKNVRYLIFYNLKKPGPTWT